jgi:hypothetical protein
LILHDPDKLHRLAPRIFAEWCHFTFHTVEEPPGADCFVSERPEQRTEKITVQVRAFIARFEFPP